MSLINWDLALKVATRISDQTATPLGYNFEEIETSFQKLMPKAETLVNKATGLESSVNSRSKVLSRADWVEANLKSFSRLLRPLEKQLEKKSNAVSQTLGATQIGILLGWMSTRVLGQYDLLILEDEEPEAQDLVYFVGPNISALEWKYGFNSHDFRLWIALHELTHRAQFTGIPWLREYFLSLVEKSLENVGLDKYTLKNALAKIKDNPKENLGLPYLLGTPEQIEIFEILGGMMSLLEGHGEVMMDKAAENQVKGLGRFHKVIRERRNSARGVSNILQKLIGIETKLRQYKAGEDFVKALLENGGDELLNQAFEKSENLPSMNEIDNPDKWIERMNSYAGLAN